MINITRSIYQDRLGTTIRKAEQVDLFSQDCIKAMAMHYVFEVKQHGPEGSITVRRGGELGVTITHGWEVR